MLIHCVLAAVLCGFVPCLLEDGEQADEEIAVDCHNDDDDDDNCDDDNDYSDRGGR